MKNQSHEIYGLESDWSVAGKSGVFLFLSGLAVLCFFIDKNHAVFHFINRLSAFTGDGIWAALTILGDGLIAPLVCLPLIRKKPRLIWAVIIASLIYIIVGNLMKRTFDLPRPAAVMDPDEFHLIGPGWRYHSFPSGHSAMAFIVSGAIVMGIRKVWIKIAAAVIALLIALSRVAVGVHWPQDIFAGAALGWGLVWLGMVLSRRTSWGWGLLSQKIIGAVLLVAAVVLLIHYDTGYPGIILFQKGLAAVLLALGSFEYLLLFRANSVNYNAI